MDQCGVLYEKIKSTKTRKGKGIPSSLECFACSEVRIFRGEEKLASSPVDRMVLIKETEVGKG